MTLRLDDYWIWDFWFAQDGPNTHIFFLHAPRSLGDPELRHHAARIGHAVSRDLIRWTTLAPPFGAGPPGSYDDLATWTGSVLQSDGVWHMFYTGVSTREGGAVQRILHAISPDLLSWEKSPEVVEADPRWYESAGQDGGDIAWRDPWVFYDEESAAFQMLITARANTGPADGRGVIGHAVSSDLSRWNVQAPLSEPGDFLFLEVPQLIRIGGTWRVLFCIPPDGQSAKRLAVGSAGSRGGTHYLVGQTKLGPYSLADEPFFVGDSRAELYAGRILESRGRPLFFAFRGYDASGRFHGELIDPIPVAVAADGRLILDA